MIIQVLMGGASAEREVSLASGSAIARGLASAGHAVTLYDFNPAAGRDVRHLLGAQDFEQAELIFIALHGGEGEDGRIQAVLELAGKPYTGSGVRSSAVCMDKMISKIIFEHHGVPTPPWAYLRRDEAASWRGNEAIASLGQPLVVKPVDQGSTIGISIVDEPSGLGRAIEVALEHADAVVFEKYIEGRELSTSIVGDEVFPTVEIKPKQGFYDYKRKYTKGMTDYECPAPIELAVAKRVAADALKAYRACGCEGFGRVDSRLDAKGTAYFLEINTIPGMTETSLVPMAARAKGITFEALVDRIADLGLARCNAVKGRMGG
ncbi:MAG TPA: D-alanine--D-alanine ligase [bacterium]|nr:D-alanine--D-alanine ligase [bacterium]